MSTTSAVSGTAAMATAPPAANITAAANWVGAIARSANAVAPKFWLCASDQVPNPAEATAAHMHSTPAISMGSQYEPGRRPAHRAPRDVGVVVSAGGTRSSAAGAGPAPWPAGSARAAGSLWVPVRAGRAGPPVWAGRAVPAGPSRAPGRPEPPPAPERPAPR